MEHPKLVDEHGSFIYVVMVLETRNKIEESWILSPQFMRATEARQCVAG